MSSAAPAAHVTFSTVSLRRFTASTTLPLDVRPLARLDGGVLTPESAAWLPPEGRCVLVVWRPGPEEPAFGHLRGTLRRAGGGWRFDAEPEEGPVEPAAAAWVVHAFADRPRRKA